VKSAESAYGVLAISAITNGTGILGIPSTTAIMVDLSPMAPVPMKRYSNVLMPFDLMTLLIDELLLVQKRKML